MKANFYMKRFFSLRKVNKILIVRLASIGDIARSTVIIELLRKKYPKAKIDYLTTATNLPIIKNNPHLNKICTLDELKDLTYYDWIINLQAPPPPKSFLEGSGLSFKEILQYLSKKMRYKQITGRYFKGNKEVSDTNIFYCHTALEELFLISLLKYKPNAITKSRIYLDSSLYKRVLKKFNLSDKKNYVGIFLGSNLSGGDDEGFRTYSIKYLEKLCVAFKDKYVPIIIGQSKIKTKGELSQYKRLLKRNPYIINLVDKTSLEELTYVINSFKILISSDSSPLHIAMALKVPVIGLYANAGRFEISPKLRGRNYSIINSFEPCFKYSYRWKFFCRACTKKHAKMYGCKQKIIKNKTDQISVDKINSNINKLGL